MDNNKVLNPNFFKTPAKNAVPEKAEVKQTEVKKAEVKRAEVKKETRPAPKPKAKEEAPVKQAAPAPIKMGGKVVTLLDDLTDILNKTNQKSLLPAAEKIRKELERKKFTVAVVGEFSKGKSTFINKFFGKEFLPVGNLPTTAMLTKIRYNPKEMMIHCDYNGRKKKVMPLSLDSWDGLTADMNGNDPEGVVLVGLKSPWLQKTGVEFEDTPGAGDLEEKRAKIIGEALFCDDGAIITVSATAALGMSEMLFIEQRLITTKTPFLMLIITKLDQVPVKERAGVVEFVKSKLSQWDRNIPVYVPYDIEMPDDRFKNIVGLDKVKAEIEKWINDPERVKLTETWLAQRIMSVTDTALDSLKEQRQLMQNDENKRLELIAQKQENLAKAANVWDELRLEMLKKCTVCYQRLLNLTEENKIKITERLQYEASHTNNPQKWWNEDYPYRLKVEIMNLATNAENLISRIIAEDLRWFNSALSTNFKTNVNVAANDISTAKSFDEDALIAKNNLPLDNINAKRTIARVATTAAAAASYVVLPMLGWGITPVVVSMGISTGSSMLSETMFRGKTEKQQAILKDAIAKNIPEVVDNSTRDSEACLKMKYDEIINAAKEKEDSWMAAQAEAIQNSVKLTDPKHREDLETNISDLEKLYSRIQNT